MPARIPSPRPSPPERPRSSRPRVVRRLLLGARRACRFLRRIERRLALFTGWTWVAAGSLIGFEAFEMLFGVVALQPELFPLLLLALALVWLLRERYREWRLGCEGRRRLARLLKPERGSPRQRGRSRRSRSRR